MRVSRAPSEMKEDRHQQVYELYLSVMTTLAATQNLASESGSRSATVDTTIRSRYSGAVECALGDACCSDGLATQH